VGISIALKMKYKNNFPPSALENISLKNSSKIPRFKIMLKMRASCSPFFFIISYNASDKGNVQPIKNMAVNKEIILIQVYS
jgi:hypothetical protein